MSTQDQKPPDSDHGSDEPTLTVNRSGETPGDGKGEVTGPSQQAPSQPDKSIHDQDTVVSPRLRQLAQTPAQPLRKPAELPKLRDLSSQRVYMLVGVVAILILLAIILVGVVLARNGPTLLAGIGATKTPTPTATSRATITPQPTATRPLASPTLPPPTQPPATPRPAPTALAANVLAKVTPPEGLKLKVRDKASPTGSVLAELDANLQVTVLEGPTEASGIRWWKVDNGKGIVGWSAEGLGGVNYLVPVGWAK